MRDSWHFASWHAWGQWNGEQLARAIEQYVDREKELEEQLDAVRAVFWAVPATELPPEGLVETYVALLLMNDLSLAALQLANATLAPGHYDTGESGLRGLGDLSNIVTFGSITALRRARLAPWVGRAEYTAWVGAMQRHFRPGISAGELLQQEDVQEAYRAFFRRRLMDEFLEYSPQSPLKRQDDSRFFLCGWLLQTGAEESFDAAIDRVVGLEERVGREAVGAIVHEIRREYPAVFDRWSEQRDAERGSDVLTLLANHLSLTRIENERGGVAPEPRWYASGVDRLGDLEARKDEISARWRAQRECVRTLRTTVEALMPFDAATDVLDSPEAEGTVSDPIMMRQRALELVAVIEASWADGRFATPGRSPVHEAKRRLFSIFSSYDRILYQQSLGRGVSVRLLQSLGWPTDPFLCRAAHGSTLKRIFDHLLPLEPGVWERRRHQEDWLYSDQARFDGPFSFTEVRVSKLSGITPHLMTPSDIEYVERVIRAFRRSGEGRQRGAERRFGVPRMNGLHTGTMRSGCESLAEAGIVSAQLVLVDQAIQYDGVRMSFKAWHEHEPFLLQYLIDLVRAGDPDALWYAGELAMQGKIDPATIGIASPYAAFESGARRGHAECLARQALCVLLDRGGVPDEATVRNDAQLAELVRAAADGGSALGMYLWADLHRIGRGVERNEAIAQDWFIRAARLEHPLAVARCEKLGLSITQEK